MDLNLTVVDLPPYLFMSGKWDPQVTALCSEVSRNLREKGALLVKDPRCTVEDNDRFVGMIERYFSSPREFKLLHQRPDLHYQVYIYILSKLGLLSSPCIFPHQNMDGHDTFIFFTSMGVMRSWALIPF